MTVTESYRYRKITVILSQMKKIVDDLSLYWSDTESTNHILNTVCPITSGVAQRKRVGLITQRSKDRNLPPLYQSRAKSANEKRF